LRVALERRAAFLRVFFFLKIYLFERKSRGKGRGGGSGRESPVDSALSREPDMGLGPMTLRS